MTPQLHQSGSAFFAPSASARRGACPTLTNPMRSGDGLLARLRPIEPGLMPAQWSLLARLARQFGNGLLDVTARGNLQIRGLNEDSAPQLAQALDDAGMFSHSGLAVETPPLSGIDASEVTNAERLASRIREAVQRHRPILKLAPKLSIVVNGGGLCNLSTASADVRLDAVRLTGKGLMWRIALAGDVLSARPVFWSREDSD
ncbi:sulfite reductase beta subunit-like hemoprotein [Agrobacterium vitis]|nr:sulfite reductase beta subunit-like hemoprotein [Agrobacterium vitis]MBE1440457.1 sulfite reductase beta subunit-like hemoprotein [Agrobacterium vitis]